MTHDDDVAKVSVVGLGMATQTGVAERMFRALADAGINIQMITTSEIKISVLVDRGAGHGGAAGGARRVRAGEAAGLAEQLRQRRPHEPTAPAAVDVVARLQRMEDLTIDDVELDETQGRVTISQLPDRPGIAAELFEAIAAEGSSST